MIKVAITVEIVLEFPDKAYTKDVADISKMVARHYANMATSYKSVGAETSKVLSITHEKA